MVMVAMPSSVRYVTSVLMTTPLSRDGSARNIDAPLSQKRRER
jgi:hypothetical protein